MKTAATILAAALATLGAAGGCILDKQPIKGTQSLKIDLVSPADPGSQTVRLADNARTAVVNVTALDAQGNPDTTYNNDVQVYVQFLGTLTPYLGGTPLAVVHVRNGVAMNQTITLPPVFGPTELWFDDGTDSSPTFATGTTTTMWYRDPFIRDIQTPANEMSLDALSASPLQNKNVTIGASRNGANGRLVVTSVFAQGYTLADALCQPGGVAPCTIGDYDTIEVFSFSAAKDQHTNLVHEGEVINGFAGGISEFDGLTEVGFPQTFADVTPVVDKTLEPPAIKFDQGWFTNIIKFERAEAAAVEFDNVTVCPLDADYTTYNQWKFAPNGDCTQTQTFINVISAGIQLDPSQCVGKVIPKIVGMLRPLNIGSFNVWIIYPRSPSDFQLPPGDAQCMITSGT